MKGDRLFISDLTQYLIGEMLLPEDENEIMINKNDNYYSKYL